MRASTALIALAVAGIAAISATGGANEPSDLERLTDQFVSPCESGLEPSAARIGGFYTNLWPNGVVPYEFVTGSTDSIPVNGTRGWTRVLSDVTFSIPFTGAQISSPTGFPLTWAMFDIIRVTGSQNNDNRDLKIIGGTLNGTGTAWATVQVELQPLSTFNAESPSPNVKFFITRSVSEENQALFESAKTRWEAVANLNIRPRLAGDNDYIQVYNFKINSVQGNVGHGAGPRDLGLNNWTIPRTITHELGHALGAKHEHQRPDRNFYVSIDTAKSTPRGDNNYAVDNGITIYPTLTYDFGSIMHYAQNDFLIPGMTGPVITILDPTDAAIWQNAMGTIDSLSYWDKTTMSFLYPEASWTFLHSQNTATTADGGFLTPWKSFPSAYADTPVNGRLLVTHPGDYIVPGVYSNPMTIEAPQGGVTLSGN